MGGKLRRDLFLQVGLDKGRGSGGVQEQILEGDGLARAETGIHRRPHLGGPAVFHRAVRSQGAGEHIPHQRTGIGNRQLDRRAAQHRHAAQPVVDSSGLHDGGVEPGLYLGVGKAGQLGIMHAAAQQIQPHVMDGGSGFLRQGGGQGEQERDTESKKSVLHGKYLRVYFTTFNERTQVFIAGSGGKAASDHLHGRRSANRVM